MKAFRIHGLALLSFGLLLFPQVAFAHPGHETTLFDQGVLHVFTSVDHLLVIAGMLLVLVATALVIRSGLTAVRTGMVGAGTLLSALGVLMMVGWL